jgi:predicted MPP superfamily phosphohydrolase
LKRLFWRHFFRILLFAIAVAEWVTATYLLRGLAGVSLPAWLHLAGPVAIHVLNRAILRSPQPRGGLPLALRRFYTGAAFTSVYCLMFLTLLAGASEILGQLLRLAGVFDASDPSADGFRLYRGVARALGTGGVLAIIATMAHGYTRGARRVWVNELRAPLKGLSPSFEGLRIAQLSDVHLGALMSAESIATHVDKVNRLGADLIVITGDITDGLDHADSTFPALGRLAAPHGVVVILGNHDVATGVSAVKEALEKHTSFTVLDDEIHEVIRGTSRLWIVGLMDRGLDWARGLRRCDVLERLVAMVPSAEPRIVLSHRPDLFPHAVELGCNLVLSGHTHGGQVGFPWGRNQTATLARFMTPFPRGTYRLGDALLHVNLGLGMTGQPVRVGTPREITLITLTSC